MRAAAVLAVLASTAGCPGSSPGPGTAAPPAPPAGQAAAPPRLVVLVVVDQLSTWAFERDRALYRGGFARMLREGASAPAVELPYANPFTAPGHAAIGTGAPPSVHGVLGNTWYRRAERAERAAEYDPEALPFTVGPPHGDELTPDDAASGRALRVEGVADVLRRASGGRSRSIAISLKARSSVFVAGRRPDVAVWYEAGAGGMTTSRAFAEAAPPWLVALARERPAPRFFGLTWAPLDAGVLARATGIADAAPGEGAVHGLRSAFPHSLAESDDPSRALPHTPYADELVLDTALAAVPALGLGDDDAPDLLAISFSAHDYAGHLWGPGSWEVLDLKLRLDAALARLFDALDARVGRGRWAAVLTSDHGMTPVVEQGRRPGGRRIPLAELAETAEGALARRLGPGPWVARVASSNVYLAPAFAAVPAAARDEALAAAAAALRALPGVAAAGRTDEVMGGCGARAGLLRAICLSAVPGESGELYIAPAPGSLFSSYRTGSHHDAPSDDNRRVPVLVLAPGVAPQAGTGNLLQVAPTVAALLGVPPPPAATEPPMFGIRAATR